MDEGGCLYRFFSLVPNAEIEDIVDQTSPSSSVFQVLPLPNRRPPWLDVVVVLIHRQSSFPSSESDLRFIVIQWSKNLQVVNQET